MNNFTFIKSAFAYRDRSIALLLRCCCHLLGNALNTANSMPSFIKNKIKWQLIAVFLLFFSSFSGISQNLLTNGDFETKSTSPWSCYPLYSFSTYTGTYAYTGSSLVLNNNDYSLNYFVWQDAPAAPGKTYSISCIASTHKPSYYASVGYEFYNSSGVLLATRTEKRVTDCVYNTVKFGKYEFTGVVAPAGTAKIRFVGYCNGTALKIDNVSIQQSCDNVTNGGTIATNQSGCNPFNPAALTSVSLPTGGSGTIEYVWMKSTTASTYTASTIGQWSLIIGATGATYDPGTLSMTTYFLRCSRRSGCSDYVGESNIVTATVTGTCCSNVTSGGTIGADQSICSGKTPAVFTETAAPAGGTGTLEYVWGQTTSLTNGVCPTSASAYTTIAGAISATYQAPALTQTTCYVRKSRRNPCSDYTGTSNAIKVTVNASCQGLDPVCISRKRSVINASLCGVTTNSYGLWFNDLVGKVSSPNQHFSVKSGEFVEYCDGKALLTYTACVLGGGSNDCITATINYSGRTATPPTGSPITNTHCTTYTPSVSDWYYYPTSTGTFSGTGIYAGLTGTYTPDMAALQVGTGANLNDIASFGASSWFKVSITNGGTNNWTSSSKSGDVNIGLGAASEIASVKITPSLTSICAGKSVSLKAELDAISASASCTPTYSWTGSDGFTSTLANPTVNPTATTTYTVKVTIQAINGSKCSVSSSTTVTVTGPCCDNVTSGGTIGADQSLCSGKTPAKLTSVSLPTGGSGTIEYLWLSTTTLSNGTCPANIAGQTIYTAIPGATSSEYQPSAITQTTCYIRCSRRNPCSDYVGESNKIKVTVTGPCCDNVTSGGTIGADQSLCSGKTPAKLTSVSLPTGGSGTIEYLWLSTTTLSNGTCPANIAGQTIYTAIPGATSLEYQPTAVTQTTCYIRCSRRNPCSDYVGESNKIKVTVTGPCCDNVTSGGTIGADQSLCSGKTPAKLTSVSLPTGGSGTIEYLWLSTTTLSNGTCPANIAGQTIYTAIPGATSSEYQPSAVTQTTCYIRCSRRNPCSDYVGESNRVLITVTGPCCDNVTSGGTIGADQSLCSGKTPAKLTSVSLPTGGSGTIEYLWLSTTTLSNGTCPANIAGQTIYTAIPGATSSEYQPSAITQTTCYIRCSRRNPCSDYVGESNKIKVTVTGPCCDNVTSGGTIGADQSLCSGKTPAKLTSVSLPTGGSGTIEYLWLSTTTLSNGTCPANIAGQTIYTAIPGATSSEYQPSAVTQTTCYIRCSRRNPCSDYVGESNKIKITVTGLCCDNVTSGGTIGADQSLCSGKTPAKLTSVSLPTGGSGTIEYLWLSTTTLSNGTCPANIAGQTIYTAIPGATSSEYQPTAVTQTTCYIRCSRRNPCSDYVGESNRVLITVTGPCCDNVTSGGTIGADQSLCSGKTPAKLTSVSLPTGGSGTIEYLWLSTTTLSNGACPANIAGQTIYTAIPGATSSEYQPSAVTQTTCYIRCSRRNPCSDYVGESNKIKVTVTGPCCDNVTSGGTIGADQSLCSGKTPAKLTSVSLPTGGTGTIEYLWLSTTTLSNGTCPANIAGQTIYTAIPGATSSEYQPSAVTQTTCYIRCSRRNPCSDYVGESNRVLITVTGPCCDNVTSGGTIGADQSLCSGKIPAKLTSVSLPTGGTGTIEYLWLSTTTLSNGTCPANIVGQNLYTAIPGATSAEYQPAAVTQTTCYLRCSRRNPCSDYVGESNKIKITVTGPCCDNVTSGGTIGADQSLCSGKTPAKLTSVSLPTGGSGTIEYLWLSTTTLSNGTCPANIAGQTIYTAIPGATSAEYQPAAVTQTTCYIRCSRRNPCSDYVGESNRVLITVTGPCCDNVTSGGTIGADQSLCSGKTPAKLTSVSLPTGGTGTIEYLWLSTTTLSNGTCPANIAGQTIYTAIPGATSSEYQPSAVTQTTCYIRCSRRNPCSDYVGESNKIKIMVTGPCCDNVTSGGTIGADQSLCSGKTPAKLTSVSLPTGGTGTIEYLWLSTTTLSNGTCPANIAGQTIYTAIPGATSAEYQPSAVTQTTCYIRCSRRNPCSDYVGESNKIKITVTGPCCDNVTSGGTIGADQSLCSGKIPAKLTSVSLPTGGSGTIEYLWLSTTTLSNGTCPAYTTGSTTYTAIVGATLADYQPATLTATTCYVRTSRRNPCSDYLGISNITKVTVTGPCCDNVTSGGTIGNAQTGCGSFDPAPLTNVTLPSGGSGTIEYIWMKSTTSPVYTATTATQWSLIIGATAETYDPGVLTQTTYFLRCSRRNPCSDYLGESNIITVTINKCLSLGDLVWNDLNNNGKVDGTETGIAQVAVKLLDKTGVTTLGTTTTDANGKYLFTNLASGEYIVEITAPAGYKSSTGTNGAATGAYEPAADPDNDVDGDDNGSTTSGQIIRSLPITLATATEPTTDGDTDANTNLTLDFGLFKPASIGDFVFRDRNANGIQEPTESGVQGVTVKLYDATNTVIATTTTDASGKYLFDNLIAGSYVVEFVKTTLPSGLSFSPKDAGLNDALDSDADLTTGKTATIVLTTGQANTSVDAGLTTPCDTDIIKPVFVSCPTDMLLKTSSNTAKASWVVPTATDNCSTPVITTTNAPNSDFPVGATTVTYTATDANGNKTTCSFVVSVVYLAPCDGDVTPPVFYDCPANITLTTKGTSAVATWSHPSVVDNCTSAFPVTQYSHEPGSSFPIGVTTVTYTAKDTKGNTSTCSFTITVKYSATGARVATDVVADTTTEVIEPIVLYPNPTNNQKEVTITIAPSLFKTNSAIQVVIVGSDGATYFTKSVTDSSQRSITMPIQNFESGIYYVNLLLEDGKTVVRKLLVSK